MRLVPRLTKRKRCRQRLVKRRKLPPRRRRQGDGAGPRMQTQTLTMAKLVLQRRRKSSTKKPKTLRLPLRSVERLFTMMAGVCWRRVFFCRDPCSCCLRVCFCSGCCTAITVQSQQLWKQLENRWSQAVSKIYCCCCDLHVSRCPFHIHELKRAPNYGTSKFNAVWNYSKRSFVRNLGRSVGNLRCFSLLIFVMFFFEVFHSNSTWIICSLTIPLDVEPDRKKASCLKTPLLVLISYYYFYPITRFAASSTAQGGGVSFKDRTPIGELGCCDSCMEERTHWWIKRWLECRATYLFVCLSIYLSIYRSIYLSIHPSIYLSFNQI